MAANFFQPKTAKQRLDEKKQQSKDKNVASKRNYEVENRERSFKSTWKEMFPWVDYLDLTKLYPNDSTNKVAQAIDSLRRERVKKKGFTQVS